MFKLCLSYNPFLYNNFSHLMSEVFHGIINIALFFLMI